MNVQQLASLLNQTWSQTRSQSISRVSIQAQFEQRARPREVWGIL